MPAALAPDFQAVKHTHIHTLTKYFCHFCFGYPIAPSPYYFRQSAALLSSSHMFSLAACVCVYVC